MATFFPSQEKAVNSIERWREVSCWFQEANPFQACADCASCQEPPGKLLLLYLFILFRVYFVSCQEPPGKLLLLYLLILFRVYFVFIFYVILFLFLMSYSIPTPCNCLKKHWLRQCQQKLTCYQTNHQSTDMNMSIRIHINISSK